jgi:hypothetical protein
LIWRFMTRILPLTIIGRVLVESCFFTLDSAGRGHERHFKFWSGRNLLLLPGKSAGLAGL